MHLPVLAHGACSAAALSAETADLASLKTSFQELKTCLFNSEIQEFLQYKNRWNHQLDAVLPNDRGSLEDLQFVIAKNLEWGRTELVGQYFYTEAWMATRLVEQILASQKPSALLHFWDQYSRAEEMEMFFPFLGEDLPQKDKTTLPQDFQLIQQAYQLHLDNKNRLATWAAEQIPSVWNHHRLEEQVDHLLTQENCLLLSFSLFSSAENPCDPAEFEQHLVQAHELKKNLQDEGIDPPVVLDLDLIEDRFQKNLHPFLGRERLVRTKQSLGLASLFSPEFRRMRPDFDQSSIRLPLQIERASLSQNFSDHLYEAEFFHPTTASTYKYQDDVSFEARREWIQKSYALFHQHTYPVLVMLGETLDLPYPKQVYRQTPLLTQGQEAFYDRLENQMHALKLQLSESSILKEATAASLALQKIRQEGKRLQHPDHLKQQLESLRERYPFTKHLDPSDNLLRQVLMASDKRQDFQVLLRQMVKTQFNEAQRKRVLHQLKQMFGEFALSYFDRLAFLRQQELRLLSKHPYLSEWSAPQSTPVSQRAIRAVLKAYHKKAAAIYMDQTHKASEELTALIDAKQGGLWDRTSAFFMQKDFSKETVYHDLFSAKLIQLHPHLRPVYQALAKKYGHDLKKADRNLMILQVGAGVAYATGVIGPIGGVGVAVTALSYEAMRFQALMAHQQNIEAIHSVFSHQLDPDAQALDLQEGRQTHTSTLDAHLDYAGTALGFEIAAIGALSAAKSFSVAKSFIKKGHSLRPSQWKAAAFSKTSRLQPWRNLTRVDLWRQHLLPGAAQLGLVKKINQAKRLRKMQKTFNKAARAWPSAYGNYYAKGIVLSKNFQHSFFHFGLPAVGYRLTVSAYLQGMVTMAYLAPDPHWRSVLQIFEDGLTLNHDLLDAVSALPLDITQKEQRQAEHDQLDRLMVHLEEMQILSIAQGEALERYAAAYQQGEIDSLERLHDEIKPLEQQFQQRILSLKDTLQDPQAQARFEAGRQAILQHLQAELASAREPAQIMYYEMEIELLKKIKILD